MILYKYVQKHHSEPGAPGNTDAPASGGMKHSRLQSRGFTWPWAQDRAERKQEYRSIHLARCNSDYQIEHPEEVRCNPESKILSCCHPEAKKRIHKKHLQILQKATVPTTEKPPRMNRLG